MMYGIFQKFQISFENVIYSILALLTTGSTLFWPTGRIFKTEKFYKSHFKWDLDFLKKALHLIIFLRFHGKKLYFLT